MKTKFYNFLFLTLLCLGFSSSTVFSQVNIYNQNFNSSFTAMPAGWIAPNGGWVADTTNPSNGYTAASGLTNLVVRNTEATGVYTLISEPISTVGYSSIKVNWGARLTVNFPTPGSAVQSFDFSTDGGTSWVNIPYTENSNTSLWTLDNNATDIQLPATVDNNAGVQFRWVVNIVTDPNGTYRIDDFIVKGTAIANGLNDLNQFNKVPISMNASNMLFIDKNQSSSKDDLMLAIFDIQGRKVKQAKVNESKQYVVLNYLYPGVYIVAINDNKYSQTYKILIR
jgi:hypothetical protein